VAATLSRCREPERTAHDGRRLERLSRAAMEMNTANQGDENS